jgi:RNA polymerase sigma-70 factor (ECF subfamily)
MTTEADPDEVAELAQDLSVGFLMMLERLSPAERVVFVLREGFDFSFGEIGTVLDVSEAACRQRFRRARSALAGESRYVTPAADQQQLLSDLLGAIAERDHAAVIGLLADDVVVYADGGGVVSAAIAPVTGAERIAQVMLHLAAKEEREAMLEARYVTLNGGVGALLVQGGRLHSCLQLEGCDGRITRLFVVRNPRKLARLARANGLELVSV